MTPRENFLRALRREGFEWVPMDMWLCDSKINDFESTFGHRDYKTHYGLDHRWVKIAEKENHANPSIFYRGEVLPESTEFDVWGIGHSKGSEAAFHMTRMHHPLKNAEHIDDFVVYPFPSFSSHENLHMVQAIKQNHQNGLAVICDLQMTIWEISWYLRSMDALIMDMMMEDEKANIILDRTTEYACKKAKFYAESGVDVISLGDDIGTQNGQMISLEMWEKWLKPRHKKVIDTAKQANPDVLIFYHSCGYYTPFIPGLLEIGVDILNPIQPECMDFEEVHRMYGDQASFWGTLGSQKLLPFGGQEEIFEEVQKRIRLCAEKGGIVLGPAHLVEPEVPVANLTHMINASRQLYPRKL